MIITDGCHLVSTENEEELHKFARKIGLRKEWYHGNHRHPKRNHPHYNLTTKRAFSRAIDSGAIYVSSYYLLFNAWWSKI